MSSISALASRCRAFVSCSGPRGFHAAGRAAGASLLFSPVLYYLLAATAPLPAAPVTISAANPALLPTSAASGRASELELQIHQYETLYYASRAKATTDGDWSQLDAAVVTNAAAWPELVSYYSWLRLKYRRQGSEAFRYPSVLRSEIEAYLAAPPPQPAVPLGQPARAANWEITALGAVGLGKAPLVWSKGGVALPPTQSWIKVSVRVKNAGTESAYMYPCDFEVDDSQGRPYTCPKSPAAVSYSAFAGASPLAELVRPGATVEYWLIFDVAPDASQLQLVYKPGGGAVFDLWR